MTHDCAECRRVAAKGQRQVRCASCEWLLARARNEAVAAPDPGAGQAIDAVEAVASNDGELVVLFELAGIVGESGRDVVTRVMRAMATGHSTAYRAHLNRLTAKYILAIEADDHGW
jgi:hypothetical protein